MFSSGFSEGHLPASGDVSQNGLAARGSQAEDSDMSSIGSDEDPMDYDSMDEGEGHTDDEEEAIASSSKRPDSANMADDDGAEEDAEEGNAHTAHTSIVQHEDEAEEVYVAANSQVEDRDMPIDANGAPGPLLFSAPRAPPSLATSTMRSASAMLHTGPGPYNNDQIARQNSAVSGVSAESMDAGQAHEVHGQTSRPSHARKRSRSGSDRPASSGRKYIEIVITDAS